MKKNLCLLVLLVSTVSAFAQVPVEESRYQPTLITTKYFGPYAFQIPDFLEGRVNDRISAALSGDYVMGRLAGSENKDHTEAVSFEVNVPLWSDRVSLTVWGEMHEWYKDNPAVREMRRVDPKYPLSDHDAGSVYFSLNMLVLKERQYSPSIAVRAATLTATGDNYEQARHFDAPGYFFDLSAGKSLYFGEHRELRASLSAGFLCWQIDRGTQNDAFLFGAKLSYSNSLIKLSAEYGQYSGREHVADSPKSVKFRCDFKAGKFYPFLYVQHGLEDWPFTQFRAGLRFEL